jgi:hypothetical protein
MVETDPLYSPSSVPKWLALILAIVAGFQALGSVRALPILFAGDPDVPGTTPGGLLIAATILLSVPVAIAGFVFALKNDVARAIMGIAGVSLLDWISYFPSFARHWDASLFEFPGPLIFFVIPACAPVAIFLAWRRLWPRLAIALGLTPFVLRAIMVIVFAVSVAIYGF